MPQTRTPEYTAVHGKWTRQHDGSQDTTDVYDDAAPEGQKLVCECSGPSQKERAALIASAPEMLAMLQDVSKWLEINLARGTISAGTANRNGDIVSQIRATINQATGR